MSKVNETQAFREFCAALEKIKAEEQGVYFDVLVDNKDDIERNIRDDFGPFVGLMVLQAEANRDRETIEALKDDKAALQEMLKESRSHNVHTIRAKLEAKQAQIAKELQALDTIRTP